MRRLDKTHNAAAAESFLLMSRMALYSLTLIIRRPSEKVKPPAEFFFSIQCFPSVFQPKTSVFKNWLKKNHTRIV